MADRRRRKRVLYMTTSRAGAHVTPTRSGHLALAGVLLTGAIAGCGSSTTTSSPNAGAYGAPAKASTSSAQKKLLPVSGEKRKPAVHKMTRKPAAPTAAVSENQASMTHSAEPKPAPASTEKPTPTAPSGEPKPAAPVSEKPTPAASGGIPQNNGGDKDADNNGGPSDGDGNL